MKRSKELIPLSHDHHQALVLCSRVQRGLQKEVAEERIAALVMQHWRNTIAEHFRLEEQLLLPHLSLHEAHAQRLLQEHEALRQLIALIDQEPNRIALAHFAQKLHDHVRYEERELFPKIESILSKPDLDKIGTALSAHEQQLCAYEDEFWK